MGVMTYLLEVWKVDLKAEDILGRRALHHAAQAGAEDAIECLIKAGGEINKGVSVNSITPLHYAAKVSKKGGKAFE